MNGPEIAETQDEPLLRPVDVRLMVRDFGPVAEGEVELRPLTVFVGPSNTGKTYLAVLMYALHRVLGGFPRLPLFHPIGRLVFPSAGGRRVYFRRRRVLETDTPPSGRVLQELRDKLKAEGRPFRLSDLPDRVREVVESDINDSDALRAELAAELRRCFDLESVFEVVRQPGRRNATISLEVSEKEHKLWKFNMQASPDDVTVDGRMEDAILLYGGSSPKTTAVNRRLEKFRRLIESDRRAPFLLEELLDLIAHPDEELRNRDTFYLPAVRGGIMQSHRVIASALVSRSTRAGFERIPQIPTFSGGVADFMQRLILYDEDASASEQIAQMAGTLEKETLAGQILTKRSIGGGYPEFVYRPRETEEDIRLTRASSMVSELAPVVLFLRGVVGPGDTLIIEEPEAHLHPAAQTQMAITLARLVRSGVRVVVTTHSDWLLQEIANLMREGEMEGSPDTSEGASAEDAPLAWLNPREVGIWLFSRDREEAGSRVEEIPFDRVEGVQPRDYEEVAEALYNRAAELQNRLAERERRADRS